MYDNNTSKVRDSNWPLVMMIKCMKLQKWFNLSDPMLEEDTFVDATIIETSRGPARDDGGHTRDKTANYTKKNGRIHHGFKAHIATDTNGIIKDYRFDTAKVHDSQHIDDFIADERDSVFANSACMSADRKENLESRGVFCGIILLIVANTCSSENGDNISGNGVSLCRL